MVEILTTLIGHGENLMIHREMKIVESLGLCTRTRFAQIGMMPLVLKNGILFVK